MSDLVYGRCETEAVRVARSLRDARETRIAGIVGVVFRVDGGGGGVAEEREGAAPRRAPVFPSAAWSGSLGPPTTA